MADAVEALDSVKEVLAEIGRELERVRGSQTQHAAMAVAGRILAAELPSVLAAQIRQQLASGELARRWLEAMERIGTESQVVGAVGSLMAEAVTAAAKLIAARAEEWEATAHQLEGRGCALEAQVARLEELRKAMARVAKAT